MGTAEITVMNPNSGVIEFNESKIALIKKTIMPPHSTTDELELFIHQAKRTGLDPLTRQIYCIKTKEKLSVNATIDGFRVIAERSGKYEGQTPVYWCGKDGEWKEVWLEKDSPAAAKVGIHKTGFREPIWAIARFDTYAQRYNGKLNFTWEKMPDLMLGKCFDEETEILTDKGFQKFKDVSGNILQVTERGLEVTNSKPFFQSYSGDMVTLNSDDLNFKVTPNHDMLTTDGKIEAGYIYEHARSRNKFYIPRCLATTKLDYNISDKELILSAIFLADGFRYNKEFKIELSREHKIKVLEELNLHSNRYERECAGDKSYSINRTITTKKNKIGFTYNANTISSVCTIYKYIHTDVLLKLSKRQAKLFVDTLISFDGHKNKKTGSRRFYTSNPTILKAFEIACIVAGYSINKPTPRTSDISTKPNYSISISSRSEIPLKRWGREYRNVNKTKKENHKGLELTLNDSGFVWCVTVPSGLIVVRRNGFSMVCGNCAEALALRKAFPQDLSGLYTPEEMENTVEEVKPKASSVKEKYEQKNNTLENNPYIDLKQSKNMAELGKVWNENKNLQQDETFKKAFFNRKSEIENTTDVKVEDIVDEGKPEKEVNHYGIYTEKISNAKTKKELDKLEKEIQDIEGIQLKDSTDLMRIIETKRGKVK